MNSFKTFTDEVEAIARLKRNVGGERIEALLACYLPNEVLAVQISAPEGLTLLGFARYIALVHEGCRQAEHALIGPLPQARFEVRNADARKRVYSLFVSFKTSIPAATEDRKLLLRAVAYGLWRVDATVGLGFDEVGLEKFEDGFFRWFFDEEPPKDEPATCAQLRRQFEALLAHDPSDLEQTPFELKALAGLIDSRFAVYTQEQEEGNQLIDQELLKTRFPESTETLDTLFSLSRRDTP